MWEFNRKVVNESPKMTLNRSCCWWLFRKPRDRQVQGGAGAPVVLGGVLQEKQNGIDRLSEMLKCLTENYVRKKKKQLINSGLKWTGSGSNVGCRCANAHVCRTRVYVCVTHADVQVHRYTCADVPVCYRITGEKSEDRGRRKRLYVFRGPDKNLELLYWNVPQFVVRLAVTANSVQWTAVCYAVLGAGIHPHNTAPDWGLELDGRQKSVAWKGCPGLHIIALVQKSTVTSWSWVV